MKKNLKLLIIGLDGADPLIIENMFKKGLLPSLKKIKESGVFTQLHSTIPPTTFPAWTSFFTGAPPSFHGISDFTVKKGYKVNFINNCNRLHITFYEHLEKEGLKTGIAWFPATYPPSKLSGFHISGWDSPVTSKGDDSFVYPPQLHKKLSSLFPLTHLQFDIIDEFSSHSSWYEDAAQKLIKSIENKAQMALWLLEETNPDVAAFYFGETDTAAHHFISFSDEASPRYTANCTDTMKQALEKTYMAADEAIGKLLQAAGNAHVIVVSDHGSAPNSDMVIYLNRFLHKAGLLSFKQKTYPLKNARNKMTSMVPSSFRRKLFTFKNGLLPSMAESKIRMGGIDFKTTKVFSEELPYAPSMWINQLGREPTGIVKARNRSLIYDKLLTAAQDFRYEDNSRVIKNILKREELHKGPFSTLFPDFILEFEPVKGYLPVCLPSNHSPGTAIERLKSENLLGRKGLSMPGGHTKFGVFFSNKPIEKTENTLHLHHIAPMIYDFLDIWPPENTAIEHKKESAYSIAQQRKVAKRLKSLGYLDD